MPGLGRLPKLYSFSQACTPPALPSLKLTAAPENRPLEKEIPALETAIFRGSKAISFRGKLFQSARIPTAFH